MNLVRAIKAAIRQGGTNSYGDPHEWQDNLQAALDELDREVLAIGYLVKRPIWTNAEIAKEVGISVRQLERYAVFMAARQVQQSRPLGVKGFFDPRTGNVEMVADETEDAEN